MVNGTACRHRIHEIKSREKKEEEIILSTVVFFRTLLPSHTTVLGFRVITNSAWKLFDFNQVKWIWTNDERMKIKQKRKTNETISFFFFILRGDEKDDDFAMHRRDAMKLSDERCAANALVIFNLFCRKKNVFNH